MERLSFTPQPSAVEADLIAGLRNTVLAAEPGADVESLRHAFEVAARCHQGQTRRSGDPYITHPVSVASIVAGFGADTQTVCAAILHDTVEDTPYSLAALRRDFGAGVADLVTEQMTLGKVSRGREHKAAQ